MPVQLLWYWNWSLEIRKLIETPETFAMLPGVPSSLKVTWKWHAWKQGHLDKFIYVRVSEECEHKERKDILLLNSCISPVSSNQDLAFLYLNWYKVLYNHVKSYDFFLIKKIKNKEIHLLWIYLWTRIYALMRISTLKLPFIFWLLNI